jgi:hypothetical protein
MRGQAPHAQITTMRFCYFLLLNLLVLTALLAQQRTTGLLVSDEKYAQTAVLPTYSGSKYNEIPLKANLRKYCPVAGDQKQFGACVGWSVGYGALTIMRALKAGIEDPSQITAMANSAAYIYNQIKLKPEDCSVGAYIEDALVLLKEQGDCLENSFNYNKQDCKAAPSPNLQTEAMQYRIQDFATVIQVDESGKSKIAKICKVLATQTPLVVGIGITPDFWEILPGTQLWDPLEDQAPNSYHAMVLIGYDNVEKQVELLNSFGPAWGRNGFIRMKYDDFQRLCRYAYVLMPDQSNTEVLSVQRSIKTSTKETPIDHLSGEFVFRRPAGYLKTEEGEEVPFFEEVATRWDEQTKVYKTETPYFEVGDAFQLLAREIPRGRYAYVFSQSPGAKVNLHFPKVVAAGRTAGFVLERTAEIVIPGEESLLQLPSIGEDYLCILYSNSPILDLDVRINAVQSGTGSFSDRVNKAFADVLIPPDQVRFSPNRMSFSAIPNPDAQQVAVPMILAVEAK